MKRILVLFLICLFWSSLSFADNTVQGNLTVNGNSNVTGTSTIGNLNGITKATAGVMGTANADVDYSVPNGVETLTNKTYDTAGAGNVLKINGTQISDKVGTGKVFLASSFPSSGIVSSNGSTWGSAYAVSGNTTTLGTTNGTFTANRCAKWDANGNLVDNGSTCSGGSGMVYPSSSGIATTNTSAWTTSISGTSSQFVKANGSLDSSTYATTAGNVATATALAANGTNCTAAHYPLGVDASGNAESCTAAPTECASSSCSLNASTTLNGSTICTTSTCAPQTSASAILSGNGSGGFTNVTIGNGLQFTGGALTGFNPIATASLSSVSSFTINSLSPGVKYKLILNFVQNASNGTPAITFNGDTGANYYFTNWGILGSSTLTQAYQSGQNNIQNISNVVAGNNAFYEITFETVSGNNDAVILFSSGSVYGASTSQYGVNLLSAYWNGGSSLSSVTITPTAGSITGTYSLYQLN